MQPAAIKSKIEIRNPKQIRNSKAEIKYEADPSRFFFFLRISDLFRISKFGFRVCGLAALAVGESAPPGTDQKIRCS
jgi:hypothetical protein